MWCFDIRKIIASHDVIFEESIIIKYMHGMSNERFMTDVNKAQQIERKTSEMDNNKIMVLVKL